MKLLLEIEDSKALQLLEILNYLPYVKTKQITEEKAEFISNLKEAIDELKLIRQGNLKGISAKELLDEL